jgi:hypothetical protein
MALPQACRRGVVKLKTAAIALQECHGFAKAERHA